MGLADVQYCTVNFSPWASRAAASAYVYYSDLPQVYLLLLILIKYTRCRNLCRPRTAFPGVLPSKVGD